MDATTNHETLAMRIAERLHLREAALAGSVLLAAAGCACSPDQEPSTQIDTGTSVTTVESGTTIMTEGTVGTTSTTVVETVPSTTSTTAEPTTTATPETTEIEPARDPNIIDMYGFGTVTMGMSREEILANGLSFQQSCGDSMRVNTGEPGGVTVDFDDNEHVEQIGIWEDGVTYQTLSGAKIGSKPDELTRGYYKSFYDAGQLVFHNDLPNGGLGYELTAFPETGNSLWFILGSSSDGGVKSMVLTSFGEMPQGC